MNIAKIFAVGIFIFSPATSGAPDAKNIQVATSPEHPIVRKVQLGQDAKNRKGSTAWDWTDGWDGQDSAQDWTPDNSTQDWTPDLQDWIDDMMGKNSDWCETCSIGTTEDTTYDMYGRRRGGNLLSTGSRPGNTQVAVDSDGALVGAQSLVRTKKPKSKRRRRRRPSQGQTLEQELEVEVTSRGKLAREDAGFVATDDCVSPDNPDSAHCDDCFNKAHDKCKDQGTDEKVAECIADLACCEPRVCETWKDNNCQNTPPCDDALLSLSNTSQKAGLAQRSEGRAKPSEDVSEGDSLDSSVAGKCSNR